MLVSNLGQSMTLLQVHATVIGVFLELSLFEDALLTYIKANKVGVEPRSCNFLLDDMNTSITKCVLLFSFDEGLYTWR